MFPEAQGMQLIFLILQCIEQAASQAGRPAFDPTSLAGDEVQITVEDTTIVISTQIFAGLTADETALGIDTLQNVIAAHHLPLRVAQGPRDETQLVLDQRDWAAATAIAAKSAVTERIPQGRGTAIVEFVSAYPNAPLNISDGRAAITGDVIARLLAADGWAVTREYYVNSLGQQADTLARSVFLGYLQLCHRLDDRTEVALPDYVTRISVGLFSVYGESLADLPESDWLETVRGFSNTAVLRLIRKDLSDLGVTMDNYATDALLIENGSIDEAARRLNDLRLLKPRLDRHGKPRAKIATHFLAETPQGTLKQPVRTERGEWTYFATDIAYHHDKIRRGFTMIIDVLRVDHLSHAARMRPAVSALSHGAINLMTRFVQPVLFAKRRNDGAPPDFSLSALIAKHDHNVMRLWFAALPPDAPHHIGKDADDMALIGSSLATIYRAYAICQHSITLAQTAALPCLPAIAALMLRWPLVRQRAIAGLDYYNLANFLLALADAVKLADVRTISEPLPLSQSDAALLHGVIAQLCDLLGLDITDQP